MCSYNEVNGTPACLDDAAQNGWLRAERGYQGLVVSDCDSIGDAYNTHHYSQNASQVKSRHTVAFKTAALRHFLKTQPVSSASRLQLREFERGVTWTVALLTSLRICRYASNSSRAHFCAMQCFSFLQCSIVALFGV